MKNLQVKTRITGRQPQYKENLNSIVSFLRHSEDRIEVKNGETVNIDIYENGALIFSGDKSELYEKLKGNSTPETETRTFLAVHSHRHGVNPYVFKCADDLTGTINEDNPPNEREEKLISALNIDLELNRDEEIDIFEIHLNEIPTI